MIRPTPYRRPVRAAWRLGLEFAQRFYFERFEFVGAAQADPGRGTLLLANHYSWWDGFLNYLLNERLFGKRFHVMMLEAELRKAWFLRSTGAFSIQKGSRRAVESLDFCAEALADPESVLLIFPQGEIQSLYREEPTFGKGAAHVLKKTERLSGQSPQTLLSVCLPDYFVARKPTLRFYLREYDGPPEHEALKAAFLDHYRAARAEQGKISA